MVYKLETSEGALLCGDDLVADVVDDKEILVAVFDEDDDDDPEASNTRNPNKTPFNHPRLAGDGTLGLSPINSHTARYYKIRASPAFPFL